MLITIVNNSRWGSTQVKVHWNQLGSGAIIVKGGFQGLEFYLAIHNNRFSYICICKQSVVMLVPSRLQASYS